MPVYRIDAYPVPATAGTIQSHPPNGALGFTMLKNLPAFIAVNSNLETYIELSERLFFSCRGYPDVRVCSAGMPSLKKRRSGNISCAFALFIEDREQILEKCDFRYISTEEWKPYGSAVQLIADSTFLVHASQHDPKGDRWGLACPQSRKNMQPPVHVCDMCRISIPCRCSLSSKDFYLPARSTGCDITESNETNRVTYMHHLNTAMIQSLFPKSDQAKYMSYRSFAQLTNPPFRQPQIDFQVPDNVKNYISTADKFSANLKKTLQRERKNLKSYAFKVDAALNKSLDFSDQTVDRAGDLSKAFSDLFGVIFGGDIRRFLVTVFSPLGFLSVAFILSTFQFLPAVTTDIHVWTRSVKAKQTYSMVVLNSKLCDSVSYKKNKRKVQDGRVYYAL